MVFLQPRGRKGSVDRNSPGPQWGIQGKEDSPTGSILPVEPVSTPPAKILEDYAHDRCLQMNPSGKTKEPREACRCGWAEPPQQSESRPRRRTWHRFFRPLVARKTACLN